MDNAVALNSSLPMAVPAGFAGRIAAMPARAKLSAGIGLAALIGIGVALTMNAGQADYKVLYANLSDKDGGAVIAQLSTMNVPYKVQPRAATRSWCRRPRCPTLRLKIATAGLPKGYGLGIRADGQRPLRPDPGAGAAHLPARPRRRASAIGSLAAVQSGRVHLALPNQNGFFREQQKPGASVLLTLHPGRTLDRAPARRHRPSRVLGACPSSTRRR